MSDSAPLDGAAPGSQQARNRLLNATALMASGTMVSRILGFGRAILLAVALGNGTRQVEMFGTATLIPNTLYMLFAGGALNTVLVPQIVRAIKNDPDGGQAYVNRIMTAFLAVLALVTVLMVVATPWVLTLWADSSWPATLPAQWSSLVFMGYLTMPQLFFFGAFFLIGQVLNARDRFGPMMWAPIANNVIQIGVLGSYALIWGQSDTSAPFNNSQVWLLGAGSTVGIIAQTLILIPYLRQTGFHYRPRWDLKGTGLGHTFHLAKWMMGYVALTTIAQTVVWRLGTSAVVGGSGAGANVYQQAYLIWILPHSLLTVSLATAMLPSASRLAAAHDLPGVEQETTRAISLATTFLMPGALGLLVLADPITRLAFGHAQGADDYHFVAWTLMCFAIGLVPYTIQYLYLRGFYALEDTRTPFLLQVAISGLNAVLAIVLVLAWTDPATVAPRLALSYSAAYILGWWLSHRLLKKRLSTLAGRAQLLRLRTLLLASLPSAALAWGISYLFSRFTSVPMTLLGLVLAGGVAILAFFFAAKQLKIAEATQVLAILRRRGTADPEPPGKPPAGDGVGHPDTGVGQPAVSARASVEESNTNPDGAGVFVTVPPPPATSERLLSYPDPGAGQYPSTDIRLGAGVPQVFAGQVLGERYRLDEVLARRGNALTWRAFDQRLSRTVLMHVLPAGDPRGEDLIRVAKQASAATDAIFLRVLDAGTFEDAGDEPYIVYEYAPGTSLEKVLLSGPLSPVEAAWIVKEVAGALTNLHSRGLYHERINPDTVIVTATGNVRIVGLLVEKELTPGTGIDGEAADVRALGELLYASLVNRWPGSPAYGMPAAPADGSRLLSPTQVKAGVPRMLDTLTDRILNATPRGRLAPITTARAVALQLTTQLGQVSAAPNLESRLRMPIAVFHPTGLAAPLSPAVRPFTEPLSDEDGEGEATQAWAPPREDTGTDEDGEPFTPVPPPARTSPVLPHTSPARGGLARPPRRLMALTIGLFGLLLAAALIWVALSQLAGQSANPAPSVSQARVVAIKSVADFDPSADGGSNAENPRQARYAIDADPDTVWLTERYRGDARLGKLKPGVGLVIDLGSTQTVSATTVSVIGGGTTVEVRVPKNRDVSAAPMRSESEWRVAATTTKATGAAVLAFAEPIQTRFLLVYLTSLPPETGNLFQGGIGNLEVRG